MHVDPEILALLALGEEVADSPARAHLSGCAECRAELAELSRTATLGRSSIDAGALLAPDARVWSRVIDELGIRDPGHDLSEPEEAAPPSSVHVAERRPRGRERAHRRRWVPVAVAASLVVGLGLGVGGALAWQSLQTPADRVLATAQLKAFPAWKGSSGEARIERRADGTRVVQVAMSSPEHGTGFDEVWLISSDASQLVSLGVLADGSGTFVIPAGLDLRRYDLLDISSEPLDGNPAHSKNSIMRGQLS
jgi:hypothetical protein